MDCFKKVLVAEDFDGFNVAVRDALGMLQITDSEHVSYCDDALLRIKRALFDGTPFDLLITDLSFARDHREVRIETGMELIAAAREIQPSLQVIVFSVEKRTHSVNYLFNELGIQGYVLKGRGNIPEIKRAIQAICAGERYISHDIAHILADKSLDEIEDYDLKLMQLLSEGLSQADISDQFQKEALSPSSVSSVEKRINRLKLTLRANNNVQLIAIAKDLGLI
ncbi:response regulator transcription factor [Flavobacterium selenitireducens]|uniref:response regulator transcription factor n=1 Tax=Flavobacterium selenitireducens TaxID=2722704 RepID=UPI00168B497C|nr:response regulator transcription factor [Flavobacterium selenitireducens]MBD3581734.1 response regulator transcription factor [Flavobacterium selenitireducens]